LEEEEGKFNDLEREFQELSSELEKRKTEIESKKDNIEDLRRDRDVLLESIGNTDESEGTDGIDVKKARIKEIDEEEGKFNDLEREFQELSSELEKRKTDGNRKAKG